MSQSGLGYLSIEINKTHSMSVWIDSMLSFLRISQVSN